MKISKKTPHSIKKSKFNSGIKLSLLLIIFSLAIISCDSDDDDDNGPVDGVKVTYTKNVKAIIDANCLGCHGAEVDNGASKSLTNYAEVKLASAGVTSKVASGDMPRGGGSLTAAQKKTIADWKKDGLLE